MIQVYYTVLNVGESPVAALRYAALAAVHYLRPLGRARLGLSCGLKGNGMAFLAPVLDQHGWEWFTLAEDVELHLALIAAGLKVDFVPETTVLADMPVTFAQAESQNERWERGRLEMLRQRGLALLLDGLRLRDPVRVDAVVEQLIPPLSVPVVLAGAVLGGSLLCPGAPRRAAVRVQPGRAARVRPGRADAGPGARAGLPGAGVRAGLHRLEGLAVRPVARGARRGAVGPHCPHALAHRPRSRAVVAGPCRGGFSDDDDWTSRP